jgi:HAD superfamily hydrolase (TIGR01484 family)
MADIATLDLKQGAVAIVTTVNIRDEKMPDYMKKFVADVNRGNKIAHATAGLDDHIDKFFVVDKRGARRSSVMEDSYKEQYARVTALVESIEGSNHGAEVEVPVIRRTEDVEAVFVNGRKFGGVLLDLDGTIKQKGVLIADEILKQIVSLLQQGYKVGIASGRSESIGKVFLNRIKRRLEDKRLLSNVYIFEQNGSYGYTGDEELVVQQYLIVRPDRELIVGKLNDLLSVRKSKGNESVVGLGLIAIEGVDPDKRTALINDLRQEMAEWGLKERYDVFDTGSNINIMPSGINKGRAAMIFAKECGLEQKDILKLGNAYGAHGNDRPMLVLPGGFGVNSVEMTLTVLRMLGQREPLPLMKEQDVSANKVRDMKEEVEIIENQALYFRLGHKGLKVGVIGAIHPTVDYQKEQGEVVGARLADVVRSMNGWIFTGGVGGVGVDVFRGLAAQKDTREKFLVILPEGTNVNSGYEEVAGVGQEIQRQTIGVSMSGRRMGIALAANVLVVINGGAGTLDEAIVGLKNGRPVVALPYGGAGKELYNMRQTGIIPDHLSGKIEQKDLGLIFPASESTLADVVKSAYAVSPKDFAQSLSNESDVIDGGIDLNTVDSALQVNSRGEAVRFNIDPAQLAAYRSAPGFVPVITQMQDMDDLPAFLGIPAGVN